MNITTTGTTIYNASIPVVRGVIGNMIATLIKIRAGEMNWLIIVVYMAIVAVGLFYHIIKIGQEKPHSSRSFEKEA